MAPSTKDCTPVSCTSWVAKAKPACRYQESVCAERGRVTISHSFLRTPGKRRPHRRDEWPRSRGCEERDSGRGNDPSMTSLIHNSGRLTLPWISTGQERDHSRHDAHHAPRPLGTILLDRGGHRRASCGSQCGETRRAESVRARVPVGRASGAWLSPGLLLRGHGQRPSRRSDRGASLTGYCRWVSEGGVQVLTRVTLQTEHSRALSVCVCVCVCR